MADGCHITEDAEISDEDIVNSKLLILKKIQPMMEDSNHQGSDMDDPILPSQLQRADTIPSSQLKRTLSDENLQQTPPSCKKFLPDSQESGKLQLEITCSRKGLSCR